jgi:hypothetical protein
MTTPSLAGASDKAALHARFQRLAAEWKEQSRYLSNTAQMALLRPYQRIIGMGWDVVPQILDELRREPDHWFWALEAITEANPVPCEAAGKVRLMAQAWLAWGKQYYPGAKDAHEPGAPATGPHEPDAPVRGTTTSPERQRRDSPC